MSSLVVSQGNVSVEILFTTRFITEILSFQLTLLQRQALVAHPWLDLDSFGLRFGLL